MLFFQHDYIPSGFEAEVFFRLHALPVTQPTASSAEGITV